MVTECFGAGVGEEESKGKYFGTHRSPVKFTSLCPSESQPRHLLTYLP